MAAKRAPKKSARKAARPKATAELAFSATLERVWVMYVVDVPERICRALAAEGPTPVVLTINGGSPRKTTMTPRKPSGYRVHIHGELRREAGVTAGDAVRVTVARDTDPSGVPLPPDLADALREADALEAFRAFGPSHQRELVGWMEKAAREATRSKRIARVVERACEKREQRIDRGE